MANVALTNFLEWCERRRSSLQKQLDLLNIGKFRTGENVGRGRVDTTPETIERVKASIAELDRMIADYSDSKLVVAVGD